jgi:hypothetical protein
VFVILGVRTNRPEALLDAETRLHNAMVSRGRVDLRAGLILRHAAHELRLESELFG